MAKQSKRWTSHTIGGHDAYLRGGGAGSDRARRHSPARTSFWAADRKNAGLAPKRSPKTPLKAATCQGTQAALLPVHGGRGAGTG